MTIASGTFVTLGRTSPPADVLRQLPGLTMRDAHRGCLESSHCDIDVYVEPNDCIHAKRLVPISAARSPRALTVNHRLPGNVRFAWSGNQATVLADTRLDGESHLAATFAQFPPAFKLAEQLVARAKLPPDMALEQPSSLDHELVQQALDQLPWDPQAIVQNDGYWELRPRLRGDVIPVRLVVVGAEVQVSRVILGELPLAASDATCWAIADHAARINARLRGARLALRDDQLVAETCLHGSQIEPDWLVHAAYAVAVASRQAGGVLPILAQQANVVGNYVRMFRTDKGRAAIVNAGK